MSAHALLAFAAGVLGVAAAVCLGSELGRVALARTARAVRAASAAFEALLRLGREGREPGALERRQLLACGAVAVLSAGTVVAGPLVGAAFAFGAPVLVSRALRARRLAYRHAVERGASAMARAIADALSGGGSLRRALLDAPATVGGAAGAELRRVAAELAAGQPTEAALEALRGRCPSAAIDAVVAATLVQRRSGGNLAGLLRRLAGAFEDQQGLADEMRVATSQARFTAQLVVLLPIGGGVLAELASPGLAAGLFDSALTSALVMVALALQVAGALLMRRLGRVRA